MPRLHKVLPKAADKAAMSFVVVLLPATNTSPRKRGNGSIEHRVIGAVRRAVGKSPASRRSRAELSAFCALSIVPCVIRALSLPVLCFE